MKNIIFKTIEEIGYWLENAPFGAQLSFVSETEEEIENDEIFLNWFGCQKVNNFKGKSIIFGFYGKGIICAHYYEENKEIIDLLRVFFGNDISFNYTDINTLIGVDEEEWEMQKKGG